MKISKEQIRKEEGKFLACVSKVAIEKILYPEDLYSYMGMECPKYNKLWTVDNNLQRLLDREV